MRLQNGFPLFIQQFIALSRKNFLLSWRHKRSSFLQIFSSLFFIFLIFIIEKAIDARFSNTTSYNNVFDPEPIVSPPIPRCEDKYFVKLPCFDFVWSGNESVRIRSIVTSIMINNPGRPIPSDKTHKGAGQWRSRSFPHYEMFCTIFGKDRAIGKGAATIEDVLDELTRTEENEDTQNLGMDFVAMEHYTSTASTNNEETSKKGKRRSTDNMDGFREAAMIIANKIDEATEKFSRAIGVDLDIANKRDKINKELRKLPNLSRAERHKALIAIGHDNEMTALFFTLEDDEKDDFVRALLSGGL